MKSTVVIQCPECSKKLKVKPEVLDGRKGRCPDCQHVFVLKSAVLKTSAATQPRQKKRAAETPSNSPRQASVAKGKPVARSTPRQSSSGDSGGGPSLPSRKRKSTAARRGGTKKNKSGQVAKALVPVILSVVLGLSVAGGVMYWMFVDPESDAVAQQPDSDEGTGSQTAAPKIAKTDASKPQGHAASPAPSVAANVPPTPPKEPKPAPAPPKPKPWKTMKTNDRAFVFQWPPGRSRRYSGSNTTPMGKLTTETQSLTSTDGIKFVATHFEYPASYRRKMSDAEAFLRGFANSQMSRQPSHSLVAANMLTDQPCDCLEAQFQIDSFSTVDDGSTSVLMRCYMYGLSVYAFQVELPSGLQGDAVDNQVKKYLDSITLDSDAKPLASVQRTPDADETAAADRMDRLLVGISKDRANKMNKTMQQMSDLLSGKSTALASNTASNKLSWRVHILPFVDQQELYDQFHLDEPWDSKHNLALVAKMPEVFICPGVTVEPGKTVYLRPDGEGTVLGKERGGTISSGSGHDHITLLEVDPDHAVEWTRPVDFDVAGFDAKTELKGLGHVRSDGFLVNDGRFMKLPINPELLRDLCMMDKRASFPK